MKVVGFSFIRNAFTYDYPIVEAVSSILPLCDEVVVVVGASEDETLESVRSIDSDKVRVIESVWDDSLREGGRVLAVETMKAFEQIPDDADWCFYIQGDEVVHERDAGAIRRSMERWRDDHRAAGLVFDYRHFYGSHEYIADSPRWYAREVRVIRKDEAIYAYRDAQGFRTQGRPLRVKPANAHIHHYGWVKQPRLQQAKRLGFHKLWHDDDWVDRNIEKVEEFDYSKIDSLARYEGTHPKVMHDRISSADWSFDFDTTKNDLSLRNKLIKAVRRHTGWRIGEWKNHELI